MMKVGLFTVVYSSSRTEGISKNVSAISRHLEMNGIRNEVVSPVEGFATKRMSSRSHYLLAALRMRSMLRQGKGDYDVVHFHAPFPSMGIVASAVRDVPCVVHVWGPFFSSRLSDIPFHGLLDWSYQWLFNSRLLARLGLSKSSMIIVSSEFMKRQLTSLKLHAQIIKIPNGIEIGSFPLASKETREKSKVKYGLEGQTVLGYYGHLTYWKGLETLIRAMPEVEGARLLISSSGFETQGDFLRQEVKRLHIQDRVRFIGAVDVPRFLQTCDIGVFSPLSVVGSASYPNTLLEMMAARTPIVATNVGSNPELIENEKTGLLVEPMDSLSLAASINRLIGDKRLREKLGSNARRLAESYDWRRIIKRIIELYDGVLS